MSFSAQDILETLDRSGDGPYGHFLSLGDPYSYLIDSRLNVYSNGNGKWAIAAERLGYNPRAWRIILDIYYFGNCLTGLEEYNGATTNIYQVFPVDEKSFECAGDEYGNISQDSDFILVRDEKVSLIHDRGTYESAGITLQNPDHISWEEAGRLLVLQHNALFRATEAELRKSIPEELKKIFSIDEWFHQDYEKINMPPIDEAHLRRVYEANKKLTGLGGMSYEAFADSFRRQIQANAGWNNDQVKPEALETWQMLAEVIATGDTSLYRPTLLPNSHWKNWPESGSL